MDMTSCLTFDGTSSGSRPLTADISERHGELMSGFRSFRMTSVSSKHLFAIDTGASQSLAGATGGSGISMGMSRVDAPETGPGRTGVTKGDKTLPPQNSEALAPDTAGSLDRGSSCGDMVEKASTLPRTPTII